MEPVIRRDMKILLSQYKRIETKRPSCDPKSLRTLMLDSKIPLLEIDIPRESFEGWFKKIDYAKNYSDYSKTYPDTKMVKKKALEHFLSIDILEINEEDVILDMAGSTSPFCDILRDFHGLKDAYHQDLPREDLGIREGVHNYVIGSDAASIPLADSSFNAIVSHNAWEHFENGADVEAISECIRLLKPGGRAIILPLFLSLEHHTITSIHAWYKYKRFPKFDKSGIVVVDESISQPFSRHFDMESLTRSCITPNESSADFKFIYFKNYGSVDHGFPFALTFTKK
jgi:SAM-dependent methyltransferase